MSEDVVVIIEDEVEINDLIRDQLNLLGLRVKSFTDGKIALDFIQNQSEYNIQLFVIDRMLPSVNGLEICKFIRLYKNTEHIPVLFLTAMSTPEQIIEGLDAGADDYMTKPFDFKILQARVRSLLRRTQFKNLIQESKNILRHKELKIDLDQCKVWINENELDLTLSEYKLLCCFLTSPGKVHTRNQLVEFIQEGPIHVTDRTIDTHIFGLRKKMGDYASIIETIRGIGYRVIGSE